jgi:hypothetical protein
MANIISLHGRQVFLSAGEPAAYAKVRFSESGTETQVAVYSDVGLLSERSQPVNCDADGVLPVCFIGTTDPLRVSATDEDDVALPGYPMDNVVPLAAEEAAASTISFTPTDDVPATTVQEAIEYVASLSTDQTSLSARTWTPFATGGSSNAYTLTPTPAITSYDAAVTFTVRPDRSNTGAATIDVNGLGARDIQKVGPAGTNVALAAGEIQQGREFMIVYDGARFLMTMGRDFPISANTATGWFLRHPDGTQECWWNLAGPFAFVADTDTLVFSWTYPAAFSSTSIVLSASYPLGSTNYTGVSRGDLGQLLFSTSATVGQLVIWRVTGATAFGSGDQVGNVKLRAIGRWF